MISGAGMPSASTSCLPTARCATSTTASIPTSGPPWARGPAASRSGLGTEINPNPLGGRAGAVLSRGVVRFRQPPRQHVRRNLLAGQKVRLMLELLQEKVTRLDDHAA